jgi:hypothetical protein
VTPGSDVTNPHDLWRDLLEKDDRTSPEEYPDMALITEDELVSLLQQYGDERARAAIEEAASVMPEYRFSDYPELQAVAAHACVVLRRHIRALSANPPPVAKAVGGRLL